MSGGAVNERYIMSHASLNTCTGESAEEGVVKSVL